MRIHREVYYHCHPFIGQLSNKLFETWSSESIITPILNPTPEDIEDKYGRPYESRVAGEPEWQQSPIRVYCRQCRQAMIYVASLASATPGFEPVVFINNDSGFHYHYACNDCHTLSVIPQWS
jgi:hypothetical protein